MRILINVCIVFVAGVLAAAAGGAQSSDATNSSIRTFIVSAKKYEFDPSEIHVKVGEHVRLRVHSVDETHGIKLETFPEGSIDKTIVCLKFDHPEDNGKVEKNEDQVLDFVAEMPGKYEFKCAKVCGMHHGKMKGEVIIE